MSVSGRLRATAVRAIHWFDRVGTPKPTSRENFRATNAPAMPAQTAPLVFTSGVCREAHYRMPLYQYWCDRLGETPRYHRKQWEHVYICQVLHEHGVLRAGARGLGFGVGREALAALFASRGVAVTATDMDSAAALAAGWASTAQHAGGELAALNERGLCDPVEFARLAQYRAVDMNAVPPDLVDFDFCWSSCSFEHVGSIALGSAFVRRSMDTLRAGGIAVHTTEYTLPSKLPPVDHGPTVLFRRSDLEDLAGALARDGHQVLPFDFTLGSEPAETYVDLPPYIQEPHLRLQLRMGLHNYHSTSVGIIVVKGPHR